MFLFLVHHHLHPAVFHCHRQLAVQTDQSCLSKTTELPTNSPQGHSVSFLIWSAVQVPLHFVPQVKSARTTNKNAAAAFNASQRWSNWCECEVTNQVSRVHKCTGGSPTKLCWMYNHHWSQKLRAFCWRGLEIFWGEGRGGHKTCVGTVLVFFYLFSCTFLLQFLLHIHVHGVKPLTWLRVRLSLRRHVLGDALKYQRQTLTRLENRCSDFQLRRKTILIGKKYDTSK